MGNYLSYLMQFLLLTSLPLFLFGLAIHLCRTLFIYMVGEETVGNRLLIAALAPTTPIRVFAGALTAVVFGHTVTNVCYLNVEDQNGELGFVENSYNPKNPYAVLGKFFCAITPALLCLTGVFVVMLAFFGNTLPNFLREVNEISLAAGGFSEYANAVGTMIGTMFRAEGFALVIRLFGGVLLLAFAMGAFVSLSELFDAFFGMLLAVGVSAVLLAVLMLFDIRAQRLFIGGIRTYAALISGLYAVLAIAAAILLFLGVILLLLRLVTDKGEDKKERMRFEDNLPRKEKKKAKKEEKEEEKEEVATSSETAIEVASDNKPVTKTKKKKEETTMPEEETAQD